MIGYTTVEQSKKLLELGLNPETADMTYYAITERIRGEMIIKDWQVDIGLDIAIKENLFSYRNGYIVPCWSLGALLDVMPMIKCERGPYRPMFGKFIMNRNYYCDYSNDCQEGIKIISSDTPIEVAFNMVVWLLENGYIKK